VKYVANGKRRKARIGSFPAMSLADGRAQALSLHSAVASGEEPATDGHQRDMHGTGAAINTYLSTYSAANHRSRTQEKVRRLLCDAKDAWGKRRLGEIGPGNVVALLDACARSPGCDGMNWRT
jgi:Arm DNA-binding domain